MKQTKNLKDFRRNSVKKFLFIININKHIQMFLNCYSKDLGKTHPGTLLQNVTRVGAVM